MAYNADNLDFEGAVETGVASVLMAHGIQALALQMDSDKLPTPRVELKFVWNGFDFQHFQFVGTTKYPDSGRGTLYVKIVTSRADVKQNHSRTRAVARLAMHDVSALTAKMPLHTVGKCVERGTIPDFNQDQYKDISSLAFEMWIFIRAASLPVA